MLLLSIAVHPALADSAYESAAEAAILWLSQSQNADGSWGADESVKPLYTAESALAFASSNKLTLPYYRAITWLENHAPVNTDYTSRRILALAPHGDDLRSDSDSLRQAQQLVEPGNDGWGLSDGYDGSPLDSALVLLAYASLGETENVQPALDFLKSRQLTDAASQNEGWAVGRGTTSDIITTSKVLEALLRFASFDATLAPAISAAAGTLVGRVDGSTPALAKAHAALALFRKDPSSASASAMLDDLLLAQSPIDGSWQQDGYLTAAVVRALAAANGTDDVSLTGRVHVPDAKLRAGLNRALGKNAADAITRGELRALTALDLAGAGVTDLTGLEEALNLVSIDLQGNSLNDLTPLQGLPLLETELAPFVVTGAATASDSYALVAGIVNANGIDTSTRIEWGATTAYGNTTLARFIGNGTGDIPIEETLSGLAPGTTYHYRLTATNPGGTVTGNDASFTTLATFNENPVLTDDAVIAVEDKAITIPVLANDTDVDGDGLTISAVTQPASGTVTNNGTDVTYTPEVNFVGPVTFVYTAVDGNGGSAVATVTVTVRPHQLHGYYVLNPDMQLGDARVVSLVDGNTIDSASTSVTLDRYEAATIPAADLHQGALITGTGPFDIAGEVYGTGLPVPLSFAGLRFVLTRLAGNVADNVLYVLSPYGDANVSLGSACGGDVLPAAQGEVVTISQTTLAVPLDWGCTLASDLPVVVAFRNDSAFTPIPLQPASQDSWGIRTRLAYVSAVEPGTTVTARASDGSSMSYVVDETPVEITIGSGDDQGRGSAVHVTADGPVFVAQQDDGDGFSGSAFLSGPFLAERFALPVDMQYVAVGCPQPGTTVTLHEGGVATETLACDGDGVTPGKVYFGSAAGGAQVAAGSHIESDKPIFLLVERSATDQEQNLLGAANSGPRAGDDAVTTDEDADATVDVIANDADVDGDGLTIVAVTQGRDGTVTNNGADVTYAPRADFHGTDTFTYTVDDGNGATDTALVTVTVSPVNDAPLAVDDDVATDEDTAVAIAVLANDGDVDGDALLVESVSSPANGAAVVAVDGVTVTYTPFANFHGADQFSYTVSDGFGGSDTAIVEVTVSAVNDLPVAVDDDVATDEDTPIAIAPIANDGDVDGDTLTVQSLGTPANGTAVIEADGVTLTYTPAANFHGVDIFTYTVSDGSGGSDSALVSVTVAAVNDAPEAAHDAAGTIEDTAVAIRPLLNDTDVDGDVLSVQSVGAPANGTASIEADGVTVTYTPAANFFGVDSFGYNAADGNGGSDAAIIEISVGAVNDLPVAADDSISTAEDTPVSTNVVANDGDVDGDTLTVQSLGAPANGTAVIEADGVTVTYTPAADFNGGDSFSYTVADGNGGSASAVVTVDVSALNDAPLANDDATGTDEDTAVSFDPTANDGDVDGDALTVQSLGAPANGTAVIEADGVTVTYTPAADFNGGDSFSYTVADGNGGSDTATVQVTVAAVNDDPLANDDAAITDEDTPISFDPTANDGDVDGDTLTVQSLGAPANGTAVIEADGVTVTYTPAADFNGGDSFSYTVADGNGATATATVDVVVVAINDAAVLASPGDQVSDEGASVDLAISADDVDGDTLSFAASNLPPGLSVDAGTGVVSGTVLDGSAGSYDVTVSVDDGTQVVAVSFTWSVNDIDLIAPVITPPPDLTVEAIGDLTPVNLGLATAEDDPDGALAAAPDDAGPYALGAHVITWSATDAAGNTGTATQTVTVQDTTAPILSVPAAVTVEVGTVDPVAIDIGLAIGTDLFDPVLVGNDAPALFAEGATVVTWTATDANGNVASAEQLVVVIGPATPYLERFRAAPAAALGPEGSGVSDVTVAGDKVFFVAEDELSGRELWVSDGAGGALVIDLVPGAQGSHPTALTALGDLVYFLADDGTGGSALWSSGGSAPSTYFVADVPSDAAYISVAGGALYVTRFPTTVLGESIYFLADDGSHGMELWKYDGVSASLVKDIHAGAGSGAPVNLTVVGGLLYFAANDGVNGYELWKSDGTAGGTVLVKDIYAGAQSSYPSHLAGDGSVVYFMAADEAGGYELWRSDGTSAGTLRVKDIWPGAGSSSPGGLTVAGARLYFAAHDGDSGRELWSSDGTESGTERVADLHAGTGSSMPAHLVAVGEAVYFAADDGVHGMELWMSDGSVEGTVLVKDMQPGAGPSAPRQLAPAQLSMYFTADDGRDGDDVWRTPIAVGGAAPPADDVAFFETFEPAQAVPSAAGEMGTWDGHAPPRFEATGCTPLVTAQGVIPDCDPRRGEHADRPVRSRFDDIYDALSSGSGQRQRDDATRGRCTVTTLALDDPDAGATTRNLTRLRRGQCAR